MTQPELLLRIGLSGRVQLRLGGDGLSAVRGVGESWRIGASDAEIGLKIGLWKQRRLLPAVAILPILSVPTGGGNFSSGGYDPTVKIAWSSNTVAGFSAGGNFNVFSLKGDGGRQFQRAASLSIGHGLPGGFDGYWEVFGFSPWSTTGNTWIANTGVTHALGPNTQFDVRVGKAITTAGPAWYLGVGFVVRQPSHFFDRGRFRAAQVRAVHAH